MEMTGSYWRQYFGHNGIINQPHWFIQNYITIKYVYNMYQ